MENWDLKPASTNPYLAPEQAGLVIHGAVYGHPNYEDGQVIYTSQVLDADGLHVHCTSRCYLLGKVAPEYVAWLEGKGKTFNADSPISFVD